MGEERGQVKDGQRVQVSVYDNKGIFINNTSNLLHTFFNRITDHNSFVIYLSCIIYKTGHNNKNICRRNITYSKIGINKNVQEVSDLVKPEKTVDFCVEFE